MIKFAWIAAFLAAAGIGSSQGALAPTSGPEAPKPVIAVKDLPADYAAFMFRITSDSAMGDLFGGLFGGLLGSFQAMGGNAAPDQEASFKLLEAMQLSWTNGKMVEIGGVKFIAAYKLKMTASAMSQGPKNGMPADMELTYIRFDAIKAIVPRPDVTKESLINFAPVPPSPEDARTKAVSNMKQIATGLMIYLADYDDEIPYVQDSKSVLAVLQPYLKNTEICRTINPAGGEIRLNMAIAGVNQSQIEDIANVPLFFDSLPWPDGKRVVAFADSHVKVVSEEEWAAMDKYLRLKLPRKQKPLPPFYYRTIYPNGVPWDAPPAGAAPPPRASRPGG